MGHMDSCVLSFLLLSIDQVQSKEQSFFPIHLFLLMLDLELKGPSFFEKSKICSGIKRLYISPHNCPLDKQWRCESSLSSQTDRQTQSAGYVGQ